MILSNCNIQDLVTEQIDTYLTDNTFTFQLLKEYITSKAPIPAIQALYIKCLTDNKKKDYLSVKKTLEIQAYKKQITDDENLTKHRLAEEKSDEQLKLKLTRELSHIPTQLADHESECVLLRNKLNQLMRSKPPQQPEASVKKKKASLKKKSNDDATLQIDELNSSILEHELKIKTLAQRHINILLKQAELDQREQAHKNQQDKIDRRHQARVGYKASGERVLDTLSSTNKALLLKSIQDQQKALEHRFSTLVKDADSINYAFFLELLPKHLSNFKLPEPEVDALRIILKIMKQHFQHDQQSHALQDDLNKKNQLISNEIQKLTTLNTRLKRLQIDNPSLSDINLKLNTQITESTQTLEFNNKLRKRLAIPGLLLLALSFLSTIPLILTLYGIIPFLIAPVFLFALTITPPAALAIATLAIGIAALVYRIKAHNNERTIQLNTQTIQNNNNQVKRNGQSLFILENETIPNLKKQIKQNEETREHLIASLKHSQQLADQSFAQVQAVVPVSYASSSLLDKLSLSSSSHTDSDEEANLSEASTDSIDPDLIDAQLQLN